MANAVPFRLLDPRLPGGPRRALLAQRPMPVALASHQQGAATFQPSEDLVTAINVALRVGAPLLLTGEPGTGKTQVAHYIAHYFELTPQTDFFQVDVRSNTTAEDLLYHFDQVAYLRSAYEAREQRQTPAAAGDFVRPGPLWLALAAGRPTVVLIDEIDKAPRDLPNDLLNVLDQRRFYCRERDLWIGAPPDVAPPLLVITSNSERRLPEPFLRRCIFHHLELSEELLRRAVQARRRDYQSLSDAQLDAAIERFLELRGRNLRKRPATAELLVWLTVIAASGDPALTRLRDVPLHQLPALGALVKDRDDTEALR